MIVAHILKDTSISKATNKRKYFSLNKLAIQRVFEL